MDALALTDLNGLYGAVFFWQAALDEGVRPIIGADVRTEKEHAVLLVGSQEGYGRLCQILTDRHLKEDFSLAESLLTEREGLIILSDDPDLLGALLNNGSTHDIYVALSSSPASPQRGFPPVAVGDVYFADRGGHSLHRLLRAIDLNTTLGRVPADEIASEKGWLAPPEEMARRFPNCPQAIENAGIIAERCVMAEPPWRGLIFPAFEGLDADAAYRLLEKKCLDGALDRYGGISDAVRDRLMYELSVIRRKGFANYFIVVEDIVKRFPLTCGRGSAAASIVSYVLKITHVEPIRHNLFFERFLNPGRVDPPDIDVDFPWDERDDALDYVFRKYGAHGAAMVANHVAFQGRAAVREVAKVYGLPEGEIGRVTKRMRHLWQVSDAEEVVRSHPLFKDLKLEAPWPEILKQANELEGIPRHLSVHCGGVVVAPGELGRRAPSQRAPKGVNIIHWEKDQSEDAGLVKIDLLGNRSLAVIRDALAALRKNYGIEISYQSFNPLDDPETIAILARGDTIGVFYVESPAMRLLQQKTGRGDFEHLVIHSSIIRPAANDFIREYVRRLRGGSYEPLHPLLEEILRETYGIMVYQEDVTKTAMALGGFDAVDGDGLRKILSKKHRTKKLAEYRERFYRGARERGVAEQVIDNIWEMILSFSGYSFCKPHSASYALVSFKSAWLRAHYPAEFMAAVISNRGGYYSTFAYISEARRMGLAILPVDINESEEHYTAVKCGPGVAKGLRDYKTRGLNPLSEVKCGPGVAKGLRVGLMQIKGLSNAAVEAILTERKKRPYRSFSEFLARADVAPGDAELLVKAGCFDALEKDSTRPALLWRLKEYAHLRAHRSLKSSLSLFDTTWGGSTACETSRGTERPVPMPSPKDYDEKTALRQEVETLGFLVSRHPLALYRERLKPGSYVPAKDLKRWVGKRVTTLGWYVTGKLVETKHGEPMEFLSFEDTSAIYETTFFPETYRRFCHMIDRERPFLLHGKVEEDFGAITLTVDKVRFLEDAAK